MSDKLGSLITNNFTNLVISTVTSIFTVNYLYSITSHKEIWILVFLYIMLVNIMIKKTIMHYVYHKYEKNDYDIISYYELSKIIHMCCIFIITILFYDLILFIRNISNLQWHEFLLFISIVITFGISILGKLK